MFAYIEILTLIAFLLTLCASQPDPKVWSDPRCERAFADDAACKVRCILVRKRLIEKNGNLRPNGLNLFLPGIDNYGKSIVIQTCFPIPGKTCYQSYELIQCVLRAYADKVLNISEELLELPPWKLPFIPQPNINAVDIIENMNVVPWDI